MENQTITINDTEYNIADLPEGTVSLINRVMQLRAKRDSLSTEISELDVLIGAYSEQVVASVSEESPQEEMDV
jgi:hypothetical protein